MHPYKKLKKIYGTDEAIANAFGIKRQAIAYWKTKGIPTSRARQIEKITKGQVTALDILIGQTYAK